MSSLFHNGAFQIGWDLKEVRRNGVEPSRMTPLRSNGAENKILGTYDIHHLDDSDVLPRLRSDRVNFVRTEEMMNQPL